MFNAYQNRAKAKADASNLQSMKKLLTVGGTVWLLFALPFNLLAQNTVQTIINDMTQPCDALPHGTEGLSWADNCGGSTTSVPAQNYKGEWMQAMTNWGQVYIPRTGSSATNTRCQIRNVVTKFLYKNGSWSTVQSGDPAGAAYVENFANNASMDAGARNESNNGGGISVIVGVGPWTGHNYHFWSNGGRAFVDINNVVGIFTSCDMRLIKNDPNGPDDRAQCKNIGNMGGDWWLNQSGGWLPDWSANFGIGGGRFKWVTTEWQSFSMCSGTISQISTNPPISGGTVAVTGVSVTPTAVTINNVNGTTNLTAVVSPSNATNQTISWSSSNSSVASVNSSGVVTGVAAGSATITVTTQDGNKTATCAVTVNSGTGTTIPARIEAEAYSAMSGIQTESCGEGGSDVGWIDVGDWMDYRITVPSSGSFTVDMRYAAMNSTCAADIKLGTTTLAQVNKMSSTGGWQNWSTTTSPSFSLSAGTQTIRVLAKTSGWNLNWIEFKRAGSNVAVTGVSMSLTTASVGINGTTTLTATVTPSNATNKTVSWTSGNIAVATVNSSGVVTGVAAGNATITVTTQDGNKTATCAVTVTAASSNKALNKYFTASGYSSPVNSYDGNLTNSSSPCGSWCGQGTYIACDLGSAQSLSSVKVYTNSNNTITAYGSTDGTNWVSLATGSGTGGVAMSVSGSYRYVKVNVSEGYAGNGNWTAQDIFEIQVY